MTYRSLITDPPAAPRFRVRPGLLATAVLVGLAWSAAPARAQVALGQGSSCQGGDARTGSLGISFTCSDCSMAYDAETRRWRWRFRSEPVIDQVSPTGPSQGQLRDGDVLVRIDGSLITTRSGGAALGALPPDVPVAVTVRRNGREVTTFVTPAAACPAPLPPGAPLPPTAPSPAALGVGRALPPSPPRAPRPSTLVGSRSWFGFGLSCSNCRIYPLRHDEIRDTEARLKDLAERGRADREEVQQLYLQLERYRQEGSRWEFSENPRIFSVDEGGPADLAGLRRGDILTHIDGVALLSDEGGRRLGQVQPGEEVEFVYRRGTTVSTTRLTAGTSPTAAGLASARALLRSQAVLEGTLREMERSERRQDQRAELLRLQAQLQAAQAAQEVATLEALRAQRNDLVMPLRYSGSIAAVNLTVRSHGSVVVTRDEETGEVVITTTDATIRVKPDE